jgi:hypothetical protein
MNSANQSSAQPSAQHPTQHIQSLVNNTSVKKQFLYFADGIYNITDVISITRDPQKNNIIIMNYGDFDVPKQVYEEFASDHDAYRRLMDFCEISISVEPVSSGEYKKRGEPTSSQMPFFSNQPQSQLLPYQQQGVLSHSDYSLTRGPVDAFTDDTD